ncbi:MAG: redox-sensing transcriptional repressor Rex [Calditrichaeota bacterium]|nr:redox-sensing transcriptional repressor Rex [Calditrichota bacterium]MCB0285072.1 redox-sensing transcriptional repressor Rex [Calditrichota bacterium]MCB0302009.1 redox-sensing transcriptional repressor Rex [Calditrichota bacterium]MCB9067819.1 redox-sensing transcriptional repressor Rex [Calditrichia bacterium]
MKKISDSTIRRLSRYYRSLENLIARNMETVSSDQLAEMDGITSAQVRKDLSFFGTFGKRGLGYNTKRLQQQIGEILGLDKSWNVAVVGAGNIGRALVKYEEFIKQGFNICLIMDADPEKIGTKVGNLVVGDSKKLPALIKQNKIDIGIIAVSASAAQAVADSLIDAGIRAILNFAPISIKAPDNVQVKSENTAIEIESLSYFLNQGK